MVNMRPTKTERKGWEMSSDVMEEKRDELLRNLDHIGATAKRGNKSFLIGYGGRGEVVAAKNQATTDCTRVWYHKKSTMFDLRPMNNTG